MHRSRDTTHQICDLHLPIRVHRRCSSSVPQKYEFLHIHFFHISHFSHDFTSIICVFFLIICFLNIFLTFSTGLIQICFYHDTIKQFWTNLFYSLVPEPPPVGCSDDSKCPETLACLKGHCQDPCACGENAICSVVNHRAVCSCASDYAGDPYTSCYPRKTYPTHLYTWVFVYAESDIVSCLQ